MAGFIRRYGFFPGVETLSQIEGVVIVDSPPPGQVRGAGTGVAAFVGEFADMTHATTFDNAGVISTRVVPQEIFSSKDLVDKVGGFDETIGQFGGDEGNGYAKVANKRFARLVIAPVNLASPQGARFFRELPLNVGAADASPVVPVTGGTIEAGREFRIAGVGRVKIAKRVEFTARPPIATGIGAETNTGVSAATQVFDAAGGFDWTLIDRGDGTLGARVGDILVIGYNNGGSPSDDAGTYRVAANPVSGNSITVQRLDGANFAWVGDTPTSWRLHRSTDADSAPERVIGATVPGGYAAASAGGYVVPVRPITDDAGAQADGSFATGSAMVPAVVPPAITGSSASALSGLRGLTHPTTATGFVVAVQGINRVNSAALDALYSTAFDALASEDDPARDVTIVTSCRHSDTIRAKVRSHVLETSGLGRGRVGIVSPSLSLQTTAAARAGTAPGVGATRDERIIYTWPGVVHSVREAVGSLLSTADGDVAQDGILDDAFNGWMASILSNLPPERNPGQAAEPIPTVLAGVLGFQRGVSGLGIGEYTALKAAGIAAVRMDRRVGPIVQSGITSSLTPGRLNINRRRMADFIQDSVAERLLDFSKLPITNQFKDGVTAEIVAFMEELLSADNPAAQRIADYVIDDRSGNTQSLEAQGVYVVIGRVRTLATSDVIVFQTEIGEGVLTVTTS